MNQVQGVKSNIQDIFPAPLGPEQVCSILINSNKNQSI